MTKSRNLVQLLSIPKPKTKFWVEPRILAHSGTMVLYGVAETFKSWVWIDLAFALATGKPWLGYKTHQCRVLMVQVEQTEEVYGERIEEWVKKHGIKPGDIVNNLRFINDMELRLDNTQGQKNLEEEIKQWMPDVVLIDCAYLVTNVNDLVSLTKFLSQLAYLQQQYGVAIGIVAHPRKEDRGEVEDKGMEELAGFANFYQRMDTIARVRHSNKDKNSRHLLLQWQKSKHARGVMGNVSVVWNDRTMTFSIE